MKKMTKKILLLLSILTITLFARTKYCKDFNTQTEAQKYFKRYKVKRLDRDKDGEACECLKGGSSYNKSGCKRWRKKYGKK